MSTPTRPAVEDKVCNVLCDVGYRLNALANGAQILGHATLERKLRELIADVAWAQHNHAEVVGDLIADYIAQSARNMDTALQASLAGAAIGLGARRDPEQPPPVTDPS